MTNAYFTARDGTAWVTSDWGSGPWILSYPVNPESEIKSGIVSRVEMQAYARGEIMLLNVYAPNRPTAADPHTLPLF